MYVHFTLRSIPTETVKKIASVPVLELLCHYEAHVFHYIVGKTDPYENNRDHVKYIFVHGS